MFIIIEIVVLLKCWGLGSYGKGQSKVQPQRFVFPKGAKLVFFEMQWQVCGHLFLNGAMALCGDKIARIFAAHGFLLPKSFLVNQVVNPFSFYVPTFAKNPQATKQPQSFESYRINMKRILRIIACLLALSPAHSQVLLNEFQASNATTVADPDSGDFNDWLEL